MNFVKDFHFASLILAALFIAIAWSNPKISVNSDIYDVLFIIDITQSMNAKDYHIDSMPSDRLSFAKESLKNVIAELPCQSKVGLGLFTTKNSFLLFEPLEICQHYSAIIDSLMKIDWRMAWAADSHIARGLYTSLKEIKRIKPSPSLIFLTDGHQIPETSKEPGFLRETKKNSGMIVGVGNIRPIPIPKYNDKNIKIGYWLNSKAEDNTKLLSSVQEPRLQRLARMTGLSYHHLESPEQLLKAIESSNFKHQQQIPYQLRWLFIALALFILLAPYCFSILNRFHAIKAR